jgi:APA family basic amino acid/polyamine antiporter
VRDPDRPRPFRAPLWWLVGGLTVAGCIIFFFSLQPRTQLWFLIWNALGLVVYLAYGARRSRLATA